MSEETKNENPINEEKLENETQESQMENQEPEIVEELDPLEILEKEKQELKDAYLRLSAETDNYRKRIQLEKEAFKKLAVKDTVEKLLPVVDNLERSVQAAESTHNLEALKEGVSMILQQFETVLKDIGLETVEIAIGDEFDPQYCEAVMMEERDDVEHSMTVVDVFETGRRMGGQVLRTAKVKVAKKAL